MPTKNLWHLAFAHLIEQRAPPGFLVRREVPLADEPQRADLLLIRREDMPRADGEAQVLRGLWPHLRKDTILEFKSPSSAFRRTDLMRVLSYGAQHHILAHVRLPTPDDLTLVLVVSAMSSALHDEIARMGLRLTWIGGGYGRIDGAMYTIFLALTDEVSVEERDELLRIFSRHGRLADEAFEWWQQWSAQVRAMPNFRGMEGYADLMLKILGSQTREKPLTGRASDARREFVNSLTLEQRLAGLTPEELMAGLTLEERVAGLTPEQRLLANPDEILRAFRDDYLRTLPADVQDAIRKRIGRPST